MNYSSWLKEISKSIENYREKISPCPFCGMETPLLQNETGCGNFPRTDEYWWIECSICGFQSPLVKNDVGWLMQKWSESSELLRKHIKPWAPCQYGDNGSSG